MAEIAGPSALWYLGIQKGGISLKGSQDGPLPVEGRVIALLIGVIARVTHS